MIKLDVATRYNRVVTYATIGYHFIIHIVIWVQSSTQMCLHCRLNIAYCCGLRTWIFLSKSADWCRSNIYNPHTSVNPLDVCVAAWLRCWPPTKLYLPPLPSSSAWTWKMLGGQSTFLTMWGCDTELKLLCCNVYCICWTARRRILFDVQFSSMLLVSIVRCANQPYSSK